MSFPQHCHDPKDFDTLSIVQTELLFWAFFGFQCTLLVSIAIEVAFRTYMRIA